MVDDSESPQTKKFKIIRDNILKAKANSSTSPFDRMKTNTLGIGLTTDQLGIRKRTSKSIECFNNGSKTEDETHGTDSNGVSNGKDENGSKSLSSSVTVSKCEERIGHQLLTEDTAEDLEENNSETVCKTTVCDVIENKLNIENNHKKYDTSNGNVCSRDFHDVSNIQKEKQFEGLLNGRHCIDGYTILDNNSQVKLEEDNSRVQASNLVSPPSLSLVAAYSDSEDTDASNG